MGAVIAGAVDYRKLRPLLWKCCELADKAAAGATPQENEFSIS
jgi:hypothetical protein